MMHFVDTFVEEWSVQKSVCKKKEQIFKEM